MNDNAYTGQRGCTECGSTDGHYFMCSHNPLRNEFPRDKPEDIEAHKIKAEDTPA